MNTKTLSLASIGFVFLAVPAFGHHSHAMFDFTRTVAVEGIVSSFEWTNPHSWLRVMAANENGESVEYVIEMSNPSRLFRRGWRSDTVVAGDEISVSIFPTHDGDYAGTLDSITLPDGRALAEEYD